MAALTGKTLVAAATGAAAVVAAGAAAFLLARAAVAGAQAGAEALIRLDEAMKRKEEDRIAVMEIARDWQAAVAASAWRNSRLRTLAGQAARAGVDVPLPPPLDLAGKNLCQVRDWCHAADEAVAASRQIVLAAERAALSRRREAAPLSGVELERLAQLDERYSGTLLIDQPEVIPATGAVPARASNAVSKLVDDLLRKLAPGMAADTYTAITAQAARALDAPQLGVAKLEVDQLRIMVDEANEATLLHAEERQFALRYLDLLMAEPIVRAFRPADAQTVADLERVARGDERLDQGLRSRAEVLIDRAGRQAQRAFMFERVQEFLLENSYDIKGEIRDLDGELDSLRLGHGDLGTDEITLRIGQNKIDWQLLRAHGEQGTQGELLDHLHCEFLQNQAAALSQALTNIGLAGEKTSTGGPESIIPIVGEQPASRQNTSASATLQAMQAQPHREAGR
ncbi:hypothetical protein QEZ54_17825 [Catellatospora sp. KI3]|uniref:hypothetical protein n=1 Tax=Catellatospora sp. KI3 TaxID=3041620 RepID=UPI0024832132|nr:hypothetical protein [Catellatospora sp. KI3]MDI1462838.1 hypothetical protein [Catellatospora sp. KI3]